MVRVVCTCSITFVPRVEDFSRSVPSVVHIASFLWSLYLDLFHLSHREVADVGEKNYFSIPYIFEV